jgi:hypothetical protein
MEDGGRNRLVLGSLEQLGLALLLEKSTGGRAAGRE